MISSYFLLPKLSSYRGEAGLEGRPGGEVGQGVPCMTVLQRDGERGRNQDSRAHQAGCPGEEEVHRDQPLEQEDSK